ncbi:MAG: branched-chain amino acid transporter ATPase/permease [Acidimicrobiia bacterium]|nr:branched-chain amino acid transporter ATPase/permease [Acidimicrobiia bacterium]
MKDILPFLISGVATGAIYGLAGSGLVLSYKTSGIFNFGHGAIATAAAYLFYWMHQDQGWHWGIAFFLSVGVAGPLMGLGMERIARLLAPQRTAMKIVGTVGLILVVQGVATLLYGADPISVEQYLPKGNDFFSLAGVNTKYSYVIITAVAVAAVAALYVLFRSTRIGLSMRAVVDDADLLATKGTDPVRVRRVAWIISTTFAALSGVLVAPLIGLEPIGLTFLVVQAFGAAALGAFSSIPLTFAGGLLIGIVADLSKKYVLDVSWLSGLPSSLPFIVLFIVLLVLPRRKLVRPSKVEVRPPLEWRAPPSMRIGTAVILLGLFLWFPLVVGTRLSYFTLGLTQMILFLSLGLLVRTSGQVSLCHSIFAGVSAAVFSQLVVQHHMPWFLALLLAALVAVPVGAFVAIPAIRLSGLFLALATFGFAIMFERLLYPLNWMFTSYGNGRSMPRPSIAQSDRAFYYLVLFFVVLTALAMLAIQRSRHGRMLRGLADSPLSMSVLGLSTNLTRVVVFCASAFFAGVAGVLYGASVNVATEGDRYYSSFNSLILLAVLALAPFAAVPWFAVFVGLTAVIPAYLTSADTTNWMNVVFGFFAVYIATEGGPRTMPVPLQRVFERVGRAKPKVMTAPSGDQSLAAPVFAVPAGDGLRINNLSVRFGGLSAVSDLTLHAPTGRITGLIGPNGAGKTTTFNACFGLNRPSAGSILLDGKDVSHDSPASRGRLGLGRTFQIVELCESLTVEDNVALGREASMAGGNLRTQLMSTSGHRREIEQATWAAMELCGIDHLVGHQAGALSTGQRRLVELARCLAGPFHLLLLDEPSSGLDREETLLFADVLVRVVRDRHVGVLLVEHDMSLVMSVCQYLYVLDFGQLIFDGSPQEVAGSPIVQGAYLGSAELAAQEAGS